MKKTNKWLTSIALVGVLTLSACGDNEENNGNEQENQNNEQTEENNTENNESASNDADDYYPQFTNDVAENEREAIIHTNMGEIHIKLFPDAAPLAVENFLTLGEEGYYDGVIFHRVIENFMIQGGDPDGTGTGGQSAFGEPFEDEFDSSVGHFTGALSMANSGPNTNGSQFFIVNAEPNTPQLNDEESLNEMGEQGLEFSDGFKERYLEVGGTPHLDPAHTVFGHVIDGMDVVDDISSVDTEAGDRPEEEVIIETVEVIN
ncbi:peptidylprolyl isomerase [Salipaludibacillus daqingensis]|uniref:peptidylprolyl isomerase n=1 Tax=Salipaludibacillus daqingensis TaxID=3041001 RepID=UPI002476D588|nr:peptidylprolyl isomerase [Salipaludibacillus daqingensis]